MPLKFSRIHIHIILSLPAKNQVKIPSVAWRTQVVPPRKNHVSSCPAKKSPEISLGGVHLSGPTNHRARARAGGRARARAKGEGRRAKGEGRRAKGVGRLGDWAFRAHLAHLAHFALRTYASSQRAKEAVAQWLDQLARSWLDQGSHGRGRGPVARPVGSIMARPGKSWPRPWPSGSTSWLDQGSHG